MSVPTTQACRARGPALVLGVVAFGVMSLGLGCGARSGATEPAELRTVQSAPLLDWSVPPAPGEPRSFELPALEEMTLPNGLRVVLVRRPGFPTVSARLSVDGGYSALPGQMAVAELIVRTIRDGAGAWDAGALSRFVDQNGIAYRASVSHDVTTLAADALTTRFGEVVELLGTLVSAPTFAPERVASRRAEYVSELELMAAEPRFHLERTIRRAIYPADHPYAISSPAIADVEAVDDATLSAVWRESYGPAVSRLVVVGDLPDDALEQIEGAMIAWTGGPSERVSAPPVTVRTCNEAFVVVRPSSAQTSIAWLGPGIRIGSPGWFDALAANQVLGGGASARLFMNLREDKSYTYGAYSSLVQWGDGVFRAESNVRGDVTDAALSEFARELNRFAADPLDDLGDAKAYLGGVFPIELQTNGQLAGRLASLLDQGVPLSYLEEYRGAVASTEVHGVRAAGARLFGTDDLTLVMVGERELAVPAAVAHSSVVNVFDLNGELVEVLVGEQPSTCD